MNIADALRFARTTSNGVLITLKRDGRPQLSNINYAVGADDTIRISITADRAKYANLRRDSRASLYVTSADFGAYVVLEGDAVLSPVAAGPDDATVEELIELFRDVNGEHPDWDDYRAAMVRDGRTVLKITPTNAYGYVSA